MAAAVFQRHRLSLGRAEEDYWLFQDDAPEHAAAELVVPGGDVPGIADEHEPLPLKIEV
jgi:hypothetical protein